MCAQSHDGGSASPRLGCWVPTTPTDASDTCVVTGASVRSLKLEFASFAGAPSSCRGESREQAQAVFWRSTNSFDGDVHRPTARAGDASGGDASATQDNKSRRSHGLPRWAGATRQMQTQTQNVCYFMRWRRGQQLCTPPLPLPPTSPPQNQPRTTGTQNSGSLLHPHVRNSRLLKFLFLLILWTSGEARNPGPVTHAAHGIQHGSCDRGTTG